MTVALRTQQIIAHESGATQTIDPLAGSYYVEQLTDRLEADARRYIDKIDELGGMVAAIEQGYPQAEIEQAAYDFQRGIDTGARQIVGVNCFASQEPTRLELFQLDEQSARRQIERLAEVRERRDAASVTRALDAIRATAATEANLLPVILDAVRAYATIGEICASLESVLGVHQESCAEVPA